MNLEIISIIIAASGAPTIPLLHKKYKERGEKKRTHQKEWKALVSSVATLVSDMAYVKQELKPNGGTSLRDAVEAIEVDTTISRGARYKQIQGAAYEFRQFPNSLISVRHVTKDWTKITGLSAADCERDGWLRCVALKDRVRVGKAAMYSYSSGTTLDEFFQVKNVIDGTLHDVRLVSDPIISRKGVVIGWVGILTLEISS